MAESKKGLVAVLVALACAAVAVCALISWLNAETKRVNAKNECLSAAIELEQGKTALLQLVTDGTITYADASALLVDAYEVPDDLDESAYADLKERITKDADAIESYLAGVTRKGATDE